MNDLVLQMLTDLIFVEIEWLFLLGREVAVMEKAAVHTSLGHFEVLCRSTLKIMSRKTYCYSVMHCCWAFSIAWKAALMNTAPLKSS